MLSIKHYLDLGNFSTLAATDNGKVMKVRSVYATIPTDETPIKELIDNESPVVTIYADKKRDKVKARYHIGSAAHDYSTVTASLVTQENKYTSDATLAFLLSTLRPIKGETELDVSLFITVPNKNTDAVKARAAFEGTHHFSIWFGKSPVEMTAKVSVKEVHNEGELVITQLRDKDIIKKTGKCLAIDIGGGTCNTFLYTRAVSDHNSFDGDGGVKLAELIANRASFKSLVGSTLGATTKIMEAVARGDFNYDNDPDKNFKHIYDDEFRNWFKPLIDAIKTRYRSHLPEVTCLLFIGGNANLVPDEMRSKSIVYVPKEPELANIEALKACGK